MNITATQAAEINREHQLASLRAGEAIEHARRAGALLLSVKAELSHGEFLPWLAVNCEISERQAQRYMRAAQGKPVTTRKLALPAISDTLSDSDLHPHDFAPVPGRWMLAMHVGAMFVIEPARDHDGHYFVSRLLLIGDDDAECLDLTKPARSDIIELVLRDSGMSEPATVSWFMGKSPGVRSALELRP